MKKKRLLAVLVILLIVLVIASITVGSASLKSIDAVRLIWLKIIGVNIDSIYDKIIFNIRLPRIILAALVGAGLGVSGAAFQGIFKNPMADPYVLGVSSGAALGATISIVFRLETYGMAFTTVLAFIGAFISLILVYNIARVGRKLPTTTLLLAGVAINFLFSSIISLSMILHREAMERIIYWTMGSFNESSYKQILIVAPIVIIISISFQLLYRQFNIIASGDEGAYSLGVEVDKIKKLIIMVSSIMIAVIVSVSGVIGFIGLIIPHVARLIVGANHRELFPFSFVLGAIFSLGCDTLARILLSPTELPVGAITSLFGAPFFIYLLWKRKRA
ncbi:corrinoid ABC transporter permease [Clostridium zeae]|uniref:Corrinoid ABC transporter permease n=1 Tax=Clostridium zeae TaxID=2759022 RepID=A0ABQ1EFX6_9CLOT|nr:iron ABC transporter permease [Clostridium zeae]GFZ33554.1 corrinoid ABC transporter permease [Clostridium zeae]